MAGLEPAERAAIERAVGQLSTGSGLFSVEDAEQRLERLGTAQVVGLEILMVALSEMHRDAADVGGGRDRSSHIANISEKGLVTRIEALANAIASNGDLSLSTAAEEVLIEAQAGGKTYTEQIPVVTTRSRRGG